VDVLASLAEAASVQLCAAALTDGQIDIKDGRHPLVERILTRDLFVPNDTKLNHQRLRDHADYGAEYGR
jgi:DNA mismatch repair protein MutS